MSENITVINHDGMARQELVRESVSNYLPCDFCGNMRPRRMKCFRYGTRNDDSNRINWHRGQFCSIGCHDSYHQQ